jgi:hypothetical protein
MLPTPRERALLRQQRKDAQKTDVVMIKRAPAVTLPLSTPTAVGHKTLASVTTYSNAVTPSISYSSIASSGIPNPVTPKPLTPIATSKPSLAQVQRVLEKEHWDDWLAVTPKCNSGEYIGLKLEYSLDCTLDSYCRSILKKATQAYYLVGLITRKVSDYRGTDILILEYHSYLLEVEDRKSIDTEVLDIQAKSIENTISLSISGRVPNEHFENPCYGTSAWKDAVFYPSITNLYVGLSLKNNPHIGPVICLTACISLMVHGPPSSQRSGWSEK